MRIFDFPEKQKNKIMSEKLEQQAKYIQEKFKGSVNIPSIQNDNLIIFVSRDEIIDFLTFLKNDSELSFKLLLDIFGADFLGIKNPRFEVIYNLLSLKANNRITVKVEIDDQVSVPTTTEIFSSAGWFEREAFDMYGIVFDGHPDLRRILTDYGFEGHPLRKDFPLTGYKEVRYDEVQKKVIYEPVKLMQEFRNFDFESPWEGILQNPNLAGDEKAKP
ncbi:MAG: NADH-quinone oxidoreductase subunit C [Rickettsiales bacterium]|jgi:NADH-quinone oxidoreductase subunit C